jgi:hypothetical protein
MKPSLDFPQTGTKKCLMCEKPFVPNRYSVCCDDCGFKNLRPLPEPPAGKRVWLVLKQGQSRSLRTATNRGGAK